MSGSALPRVSVVMPVRNEGRFIRASLGAVLDQSYPPDRIEVLVVDGRSDDDTREQVLALAGETEIPVEILDNPTRTAAAALNLGVAAASGEVILRVDGHCLIGKEHLRRAVEALAKDEGAGCVGGPVETVGEGLISEVIAAAMASPFGVGDSSFRTSTRRNARTLAVDTVPFPAFPRSVLERAGRFDEELVRNQDDEYSFRLRKLGYRIGLVPGLSSRYYARTSLRGLFRQYFQYGFFKVRVLQLHPKQMKARHFVPTGFVAALSACLLLLPAGHLPLVALSLSYGAASLAASGVAAARSRLALLPLLPVAFATLHLAYGAGFLLGLLRFGGRWLGARAPEPADHDSDSLGAAESSS